MAVVTFEQFDSFYGRLGDGTIDLDTHTFKAVLTNTAPDLAVDEELADIIEIANGNGYTTGGLTLSGVTLTEVSPGVWRWTCTDFEWNADGGPIGPFRYVVIYDDDAPNDELVGRYDYQTEVTVPDGSAFRASPGTDGIFYYGTGTVA